MTKMTIFSSFLALVLSGCVSSSQVAQVSENRYFVTAKDTGGVFSKDGKVVGEATQEARAYCRQQGKEVVLEDMKRDPEGPMRFETADIYFSCQPTQSTQVEISKAQEKNQKLDKSSYIDELKALAALRDDGILTEEEFQKQKAEIMERE